jgi:hypothetical protein
MKRGHALLISLIVLVAAVFGAVAARHTVALAHPSQTPAPAMSSAQIAAANHSLDRTEARLRHMLNGAPSGTAAVPAAPAAQRTVYVRPAPHVVTIHRSGGGEHEAEGEHEGGGEFDD